MRRFAFAVIAVMLLALPPIPASPWVAGYRVGLDGYDVPGLSSHEYVSVSLFADLVPSLLLSPSVHLGVALPKDREALVSVGAGSGVLVWHDHPLRPLFRRESAYVPRIDLSVGIGFSSPYWMTTSVLLQPLRFHFGDKQVGIMGLHLVHDRQADAWGWGLRLFEITHYLW